MLIISVMYIFYSADKNFNTRSLDNFYFSDDITTIMSERREEEQGRGKREREEGKRLKATFYGRFSKSDITVTIDEERNSYLQMVNFSQLRPNTLLSEPDTDS